MAGYDERGARYRAKLGAFFRENDPARLEKDPGEVDALLARLGLDGGRRFRLVRAAETVAKKEAKATAPKKSGAARRAARSKKIADAVLRRFGGGGRTARDALARGCDVRLGGGGGGAPSKALLRALA